MKRITALILLLMTLLSFSLVSCLPVVNTVTSTTTTQNEGLQDDIKDNTKEEVNIFEKIPAIYVMTEGLKPVQSKEEYVDCEVSLTNCPIEYSFVDLKAGIRTRGNSSSMKGDPIYALYNQVPYRIKFDKKQSMLGLNDGAKCKSWVLLKPDSAHAFTYIMGQYIVTEEGYYCSDCQYVELYLNNEYKGVYLLAEQSQINENRVDIFETPDDYTSKYTGYFLELNNYPEATDKNFYTNFWDVPLKDLEGGRLSHWLQVDGQNIHRRCYTLKNDNVSEEQHKFIEQYLNNVFYLSFAAIFNEKYYEFSEGFFNLKSVSEADAKELIGRYIDLDSLVNMYLMQEISMNTDVGAGSFYLSVDFSEQGNKKLTFECPWDFDWGYHGNSRYTEGKENYVGLSAATFCPDYFAFRNSSRKDRSNPWLILFMNASWFREMVYERFCELKENGAFDKTVEQMEFYLENYTEAFERNYEKWGTLEVEKDIVENIIWFKNRIAWLDAKFADLAVKQ